MTNLTIDIGNSHTKYAYFENDSMTSNGRVLGHDISSIKAYNEKSVDNCIVCATINLDEETKKQIKGLGKNVIFMDHSTPVPITNRYKSPLTLGMDRLAAAIGAYSKVKNDVIIIDAGTAITYDFVNNAGEYLGGNISPGMNLRFLALHEHTAKLPKVEAEGNHPHLGEDTETAIRCGVIDGMKYEIEGYIREFSLKYPNLSIFLTGGDDLYFEDEIKLRTFADNYLVLEGLNQIIKHNIKLQENNNSCGKKKTDKKRDESKK
ncbi:MAG: type III pantothenate kinase [Bacteroidaceae bacterium]|nr:type III pantothenate kinase [Bacteroidaceae bacterium]